MVTQQTGTNESGTYFGLYHLLSSDRRILYSLIRIGASPTAPRRFGQFY